jgi:SulP family sulfate permease
MSALGCLAIWWPGCRGPVGGGNDRDSVVDATDSQGGDTLVEIIELATSRDIELRLTRVKTDVKDVLRRDGVIDRLGEGRIYGNVYEAVADQIPEARVPQAASDEETENG